MDNTTQPDAENELLKALIALKDKQITFIEAENQFLKQFIAEHITAVAVSNGGKKGKKNLISESGDGIIKTNNTVVESGGSILKTNNAIVESGDDILKTNNTIVKSGDGILKTNNVIVESGDSILKTNNTVVELGDDILKTNNRTVESGGGNIINHDLVYTPAAPDFEITDGKCWSIAADIKKDFHVRVRKSTLKTIGHELLLLHKHEKLRSPEIRKVSNLTDVGFAKHLTYLKKIGYVKKVPVHQYALTDKSKATLAKILVRYNPPVKATVNAAPVIKVD